jgi:hypothetical protein
MQLTMVQQRLFRLIRNHCWNVSANDTQMGMVTAGNSDVTPIVNGPSIDADGF